MGEHRESVEELSNGWVVVLAAHFVSTVSQSMRSETTANELSPAGE